MLRDIYRFCPFVHRYSLDKVAAEDWWKIPSTAESTAAIEFGRARISFRPLSRRGDYVDSVCRSTFWCQSRPRNRDGNYAPLGSCDQELLAEFLPSRHGSHDDRQARTLKQNVDAILQSVEDAGIKHGRGILILPTNGHSDLHNFVKRRLRDRLQFQCLDAGKIPVFLSHRSAKRCQTDRGIPSPREALSELSAIRPAGFVDRQPAVGLGGLQEGTRYDTYVCLTS